MSTAKEPSLLSALGTVAAALVLASVFGRHPPAKPVPAAFGGTLSTQEPHSIQVARAAEPGRGREAPSPLRIPWAGWRDIFKRTWRQIEEDRLLAIAGGVVFFALLALFPTVTALVSSYGLVAKASSLEEHLSFFASVVPAEAWSIVREQIVRVASKPGATLGLTFLSGLALALWSANSGMKAIIDALNVVYEEDEKRGFFRLNLVSLAFTIGAIGAALFAVGAVVALPLVLSQIGLGSWTEDVLRIARWPVLLLGMLAGLAVLYRYGPSRQRAKWQWISVGAVLASLLWLIGSLGLSFYLANFGHYDATYGSLGAAIGTMMWMWMSAIVILLGAELNAEIEHQTAVDSTIGGDKPLGARGAAMADTVGDASG
jgi:membrane protein